MEKAHVCGKGRLSRNAQISGKGHVEGCAPVCTRSHRWLPVFQIRPPAACSYAPLRSAEFNRKRRENKMTESSVPGRLQVSALLFPILSALVPVDCRARGGNCVVILCHAPGY